MTAAQLSNQVRLRARQAIAQYYDGTLVSDDELHPLTTRNICLRAQVPFASFGAAAGLDSKHYCSLEDASVKLHVVFLLLKLKYHLVLLCCTVLCGALLTGLRQLLAVRV